MSINATKLTQTDECHVHGKPSKSANRALLCLILVSFALIFWHVWSFGPSSNVAKYASEPKSFPFLLGDELWDLLTNRHGILGELWEVFPYYIAGVLLAGYFRTYKIATKMQASLKRYGVLSVVVASFVGIITPLCACGTITTAVSLLFAGFPLAPVMALMVTSPLMSPSTYLLTLNDLGPEWTVIRTVAALSMGIFAGLITHFLRNKGFRTGEIFVEGGIIRGDFHDEDYPDERLRCNCRQNFGNRVAVRTSNKFIIFLAKSSEMLWLVGKYVIVGVMTGIIIERYMPYEWIYRFFGQSDPLNIVWVTLGSVPIFLHQISGSSVLAHIKNSLHGTIDAGAALAFMIGGPVTAVPTMVMFWSIFKKRVFLLYMFVCIVGTVLIAYAFQFLVFIPGVDTGNCLLRGVHSLSGGGSSVIQKKNQNVRIVMDPAGQSIIAMYSNDLERQGGIVFDSGCERFLSSSADRYDNRKYIGNVAKWLEDNNASSANRNILVYNIAGGDGGGPIFLNNNVLANLVNNGFKVKVTNRREVPEITGRMLHDYSQIWVFFGESGTKLPLTSAELSAIAQSTMDGKSMLVVSGKQHAEPDDNREVNALSSRYGVLFSGFIENGKELPVGVASNLFSKTSEILGKILKIVHKA